MNDAKFIIVQDKDIANKNRYWIANSGFFYKHNIKKEGLSSRQPNLYLTLNLIP
jgi:hypothetical protein